MMVFAFSALLMVEPDLAQERGNSEATINSQTLKISYGIATLQDRSLQGYLEADLVLVHFATFPVEMTWALGVGSATELQSTGTLIVAGKEIPPGTYSLWVRKKADHDGWFLAFHPKIGISADSPPTNGYTAELPLKIERAAPARDQLRISLRNLYGNFAGVAIDWLTTRLSGRFSVK